VKKLMFVLAPQEGEGWKGDTDAEEMRQQIRDQLKEEVPVVILPAGLSMWTIELGDEEGSEKAPSKEKS
jgi:hypothetical protein